MIKKELICYESQNGFMKSIFDEKKIIADLNVSQ
jgi:hypothetical protein